MRKIVFALCCAFRCAWAPPPVNASATSVSKANVHFSVLAFIRRPPRSIGTEMLGGVSYGRVSRMSACMARDPSPRAEKSPP